MKKILTFILAFSMLLSLASCTYKYKGDDVDLFTTAIHSILWTEGCSSGHEWKTDPIITVIDKDQYGRVLFRYTEDVKQRNVQPFSSLVILQSSTEDFVYYYENINYIVKAKEGFFHEDEAIFFDNEIQLLKNANDWNEPIDLNKCVKKTIVKHRPQSLPIEESEMEAICETKVLALYNNYDTHDYRFFNFTQDEYGREIWFGIVHPYNNHEDWENLEAVFLVFLFQKDLSYAVTELPQFDYQEQFIQFKAENGWNFPPEN